jgi:hypothetical protein
MQGGKEYELARYEGITTLMLRYFSFFTALPHIIEHNAPRYHIL